MAQPPRASELHGHFLSALQVSLGRKVDVRPLSRWNTLGAGIAQIGVRDNLVAVRAHAAAFLDTAEDTDLDTYCARRGPVVRHAAAKAKGSYVLTRATAGGGAGTIYAGTEIRVPKAEDGRSYRFLATVDRSILSSALTVEIPCEAVDAGEASNVGTVTGGLALTGTPGPLFDTTLLPSSITVAGGYDVETDPELRERQRVYEQGRQKATMAAVIFGCLLVPQVKHVVAVNVRDPHLGSFCRVYIGDVNWESTETMLDDVATLLEAWRGMGPSCTVAAMTQSDVTVTATLRMARPIAFYDVNKVRAAAVKAVRDYFDARIDPYAYELAMIQGRLARVHDEVSSVTLASPVASATSPISPSAFAIGGLPSTLTRYRAPAENITIDVEGPT